MSTFDAYAYPLSACDASVVGSPAAVDAEPDPDADADAEATDAEAEPELDAEADAEPELELEPELAEFDELFKSLTLPPSSSPQPAATRLTIARIGINSIVILDFKIPPILGLLNKT